MRRTGVLLAATALLMVVTAGAALAANIDGDARDNRLVGTVERDTIRAFGGDDTVRGLRSDDEVRGSLGEDFLYGNRGDDTIMAGQGSDGVIGGRGDDVIFVGGDNRPGSGTKDRVNCGPGSDTAYVDAGFGAPGPDFQPSDGTSDDCENIVIVE